jgi:hypothetical protein
MLGLGALGADEVPERFLRAFRLWKPGEFREEATETFSTGGIQREEVGRSIQLLEDEIFEESFETTEVHGGGFGFEGWGL